jgi:hypothetical protein
MGSAKAPDDAIAVGTKACAFDHAIDRGAIRDPPARSPQVIHQRWKWGKAGIGE